MRLFVALLSTFVLSACNEGSSVGPDVSSGAIFMVAEYSCAQVVPLNVWVNFNSADDHIDLYASAADCAGDAAFVGLGSIVRLNAADSAFDVGTGTVDYDPTLNTTGNGALVYTPN